MWPCSRNLRWDSWVDESRESGVKRLSFTALEQWGPLQESPKHSQIVFIDLFHVSDWVDSLIGPSGLVWRSSSLPPTLLAVPVSYVWVGKLLVTKMHSEYLK
jgi:hypothetical protein